MPGEVEQSGAGHPCQVGVSRGSWRAALGSGTNEGLGSGFVLGGSGQGAAWLVESSTVRSIPGAAGDGDQPDPGQALRARPGSGKIW